MFGTLDDHIRIKLDCSILVSRTTTEVKYTDWYIKLQDVKLVEKIMKLIFSLCDRLAIIF